MGKVFNITADCKPNLHYMVDLTSRLEQIKSYAGTDRQSNSFYGAVALAVEEVRMRLL